MKTVKKDSIECYPFFLCVKFSVLTTSQGKVYFWTNYSQKDIKQVQISHIFDIKIAIIIRRSFWLRTPVVVLFYAFIIGKTANKK